MANYFLDNQDLLSHYQQLDLQRVFELEILANRELANIDGNSASTFDLNSHSADLMELYHASLTLCGDISANFIAPRAQSVDEEGAKLIDGHVHYAKGTIESRDCLSKAGFMGVIVPEEFGGLGFPATIYTMMIELVSQADASMMTLFGYQDIGETRAHLAPNGFAKRLLPDYCKGDKIGAMVLTEPSGGSDLQALKTTAHQDENGNWFINGTKQFISHGNGDVLLVLARSEKDVNGIFGLSLFVVEDGVDNGVNVARIEKKMGLHGSPTCELHFQNSRATLMGKQRFGLFHVVDTLNHARFSVAAQALGIAQPEVVVILEIEETVLALI
jgi:hypothetical protein